MKKRIIIAGSGISGISVGKILQNNYDVEIFEKQETIGGLIKCKRVKGNLFHLVGGHVFNSKNPAVLNWFWSHFNKETEFIKADRNAKILINNNIIGYPIENFIYELPREDAKIIFKELLELYKNSRSENTSNSFDSYLKNNFGLTLYELYFKPYNEKIWDTDLSKIPLEWLKGKLPMPDISKIILSNLLKEHETEMVHSTFFYPIKNGSQFIIDRLSKGLKIKKSTEVVSIKQVNKKLLINDQYTSEILIFCGDVRELCNIVNIADKHLQKALMDVRDLPSNGTSNILCETDPTEISWLYLPENKYKAHRIIYSGNFSIHNNKSLKRKSCVVEFSGNHHTKEEMLNEIKKLPGNLKAISFNFEKKSYILNNADTRKRIDKLQKNLKKYNIYLLGRFAEWKYYNMDQCIESAMELSDTLLGKKKAK